MRCYFSSLCLNILFLIAAPFISYGTAYGIYVDPGCENIAEIANSNIIKTAINCKGFVAYAWTDSNTNTIEVAITKPGKHSCKSIGNAVIQPDVKFSSDSTRINVGVDEEGHVYVSFIAKTLDDSSFVIKVSRYNTKSSNPVWEDFSNGLPSPTIGELFFFRMVVNDAGDIAMGWAEDVIVGVSTAFNAAVYNQSNHKWYTNSNTLVQIPTVSVVINSKGRAFYMVEEYDPNAQPQPFGTSILKGMVMNASKKQSLGPIFPELENISDPAKLTDLQINALSIDKKGDCIAFWHYNTTECGYNRFSNETGVWADPASPFISFGIDTVDSIVMACDQKSGNAGLFFIGGEDDFLYASTYDKKNNTWLEPVILDNQTFFDSDLKFVVDCHGTGIATWQVQLSTPPFDVIYKTTAYPLIKEASLSNPQALDLFSLNTSKVVLGTSLKCCDCNVRTGVAFSGLADGDNIILQSNYFYYLLSPSSLKGKQVKDKFLLQETFVNIITWNAPCSTQVPIVEYKIYRDAELKHHIGTVKGSHELIFKDRYRKRGKTYTYYIVAIDQNQNQSEPSSVKVRPST